ncbi:MAG: 23S rRNA (uracil(1939)-C(5))-methyltransferase RlmD [Bacillaceae bacterium]|nr:23S rRNA (uracil(1939)-C(5))-methyltransferase RlmD [Bacillaceae bacterium]
MSEKRLNRKGQNSRRRVRKPGDFLDRGDFIPVLTIKRLGLNGEGIGYYRKKVVFVNGVLPGEEISARVTRVEKNYIEAELVKVKKASPRRTDPVCSVYAECGGCQLQHVDYEGQLAGKQEHVEQAFQKYVSQFNPDRENAVPVPIRPIVGMEDPWGYRNKAQLQVGTANGRLITGLYATGSHRLVDLSECPVQHPRTTEMIRITRDVLEELKIPAYDERKRTGVIRTIMARVGMETGESQLALITATENLPRKKELVTRLRSRMPDVKSIVQNINPKKTSLIFGEKTRVLWGEETIREKLGNLQFSLSPRSFFQLNPAQTVKLYDFVREAAALTGKESVVDAYCGVGTIGLWLAADAREVRGIEVIPEAVENARRNAELSGIRNVMFYEGKAEELLPRWAERGYKPDVLVVDPPRTGLDRKLLDTILAVKPERMVYVSCNPSTLAKDCDVLIKGGYQVKWIQPVDMFPQTGHVECCSLLVRKDN